MAEDRTLAGMPSVTLVKNVKRVLRLYCECRPVATDTKWRLTWEWAYKVEQRNRLWDFSKAQRRKWPTPSEIASQYLVICLAGMKNARSLRLPYHAAEQMPKAMTEALRVTPNLSAPADNSIELKMITHHTEAK